MFGLKTRKSLALAALVALAGACETGTEPDNPKTFDADAALADHQAFEAVLASESMNGFRAFGAGLSLVGVAPEAGLAVDLVGAIEAPTSPSAARTMAGRIFSLAEARHLTASQAPIISEFRRGMTFVYDSELGRYVVDESLTGAPETGIRFILYEEGLDGKPDPSAEIGYVDLIDEGDDSEEDIALWLVVVEGSDTILDYRTTLDLEEGEGEITVEGYLQGEDDRLDFDIHVAGSETGGAEAFDIEFEMGIEARDFSIEGESESSIDGTFYLNGDLFATVTGDPDDPTFEGATGEPLTWAEFLVLRQMVDWAEDVWDLFEDLLDPVDELVLLAIIL